MTIMARIRTIKPEFFTHEDLFDLERETSYPIRVAFAGLWTQCDRKGRFKWKPRTLKAAILPYDEVDFSRVLDALWARGFIDKYADGREEFGVVPSFSEHQVINNRESDSILPEPQPDCIVTRGSRVGHAKGTPLKHAQAEGKGKERKGKEGDSPKGDGVADAPPIDIRKIFEGIEKKKKPLYDFIGRHRPDFIEPYVQLWNIFAAGRGKAQISKVSDARRKKFKTRINEKDFDFLKVLEKAGKAGDFLSVSKWFTFDWIMKSEENYLKVLEGNYDKEDKKPAAEPVAAKDLEYLYARFLDDALNSKDILEPHCDFLLQQGVIDLDERFILQAVARRVEQLTGTNEAPQQRMIEAYQAGTWPADPDCIQDKPYRERIAKKFALYALFQAGKTLGSATIADIQKLLADATEKV